MVKKQSHTALRTLAAALAAALTLWTVSALGAATSFSAALQILRRESLPLALLRYTLGDTDRTQPLSADTALVLHFSPLLASAKAELPPSTNTPSDEPPAVRVPQHAESSELPALRHADNGVSARTLRPAGTEGYIISGKTFISNASGCTLSPADLRSELAPCPTDGPQVLILHTHATESYTMPAGEEYVPSDEWRTLEEEKNMLRVGEEIAAVLTQRGLQVLHDRTLHDYPNYSGAYNRSLATAESYLAEFPTIRYVLDVHRDAVEDEAGQSYKLLCAEEPQAAQMEFVLGTNGGGAAHENWKENLTLACAVQETILAEYPTLMRPIIVRNSRYNQHLTPGSLLIEVGTAGNSLDEALTSARIFAESFADTVLQ